MFWLLNMTSVTSWRVSQRLQIRLRIWTWTFAWQLSIWKANFAWWSLPTSQHLIMVIWTFSLRHQTPRSVTENSFKLSTFGFHFSIRWANTKCNSVAHINIERLGARMKVILHGYKMDKRTKGRWRLMSYQVCSVIFVCNRTAIKNSCKG